MSNYQAVFDAVRLSLSNCDVGRAVENAIGRPDIDFQFRQCAQDISGEMTRPSVVFRPKIFLDGDRWCALYGENIQNGVAAFGESPYHAAYAFDMAWSKSLVRERPTTGGDST